MCQAESSRASFSESLKGTWKRPWKCVELVLVRKVLTVLLYIDYGALDASPR